MTFVRFPLPPITDGVQWVPERIRRRWREQPSLSDPEIKAHSRPLSSAVRLVYAGSVGLTPDFRDHIERKLAEKRFIELRGSR